MAVRHRPIVRLVSLLALLVAASAAAAQFGGRSRDVYRTGRDVPPDSYTGAFLFCRIAFRNQVGGDGGGWSVDWPRSDVNLSFRLAELTKAPIGRDVAGQIKHIVIRLTDPELYRCPFVMITEPGGAYFDDREAAALADYLAKGGFLWADDFWGEHAWAVWTNELAKALPRSMYPVVDLPLQHELFHTLYDLKDVPQIPSIGFWLGTGLTSERYDSREVHVRAVFDDRRRIMVLMTHNTDYGDAFERETDDRSYFLEFAADGYAFAVNTLLYAMTH
jgi:hypothetical protein